MRAHRATGADGFQRSELALLIVTDSSARRELAELYRRSAERYLTNPNAPLNRQLSDPARRTTAERVRSSAAYLAEHLHEVPVHVIPCIAARPEGLALAFQATVYGSIVQAAWSFMLAARARGLGTCWTTLHLVYEQEAAKLLGIPHDRIAQVGLIPIAYSVGWTSRPDHVNRSSRSCTGRHGNRGDGGLLTERRLPASLRRRATRIAGPPVSDTAPAVLDEARPARTMAPKLKCLVASITRLLSRLIPARC